MQKKIYMGKYTNQKKLSKQEQEDLFIRFAEAMASIKDPVEAAHFIRELLSEPESVMLARRLQIVDLLEDGLTYAQIQKTLKVSFGTIAKMQSWLELYGEDFRKILRRTHKEKAVEDVYSPWNKMKRKYSIYFWPGLLLKEIVNSANKREKEKLRNVIKQYPQKTKLVRDLSIILNRTRVGKVNRA